MKKISVIPRTLIFFYGIPYLVALFFTALYCFGEIFFWQWMWLTEWMIGIPAFLSEYTLFMTVYGFFGICAYYVFFGKRWQKIAVPIISVVCAFFFPALRYLLRHLICGGYLNDLDMYDMYADDVMAGFLLASYCVIALLVILIERAYYAWILRESPVDRKRTFSPRHPVGLTMMLFFACIFVWGVVEYVLLGEYTWTSALMLLLELAIDVAGFWAATLAADKVSKWHKKEAASASECLSAT